MHFWTYVQFKIEGILKKSVAVFVQFNNLSWMNIVFKYCATQISCEGFKKI